MSIDMNLAGILFITVLGTIIMVELAAPVARLAGRLRTATRNAYRRMIGMESFESMVIDEMRGVRRDMDNYTRGLPNRVMIERTIRQQRDMIQAQVTRTNRARTEVEELGIQLRNYTDTLGPIWNTAQGHRMPMRLLSSSHLNNIVEGGFGSYEARDFASTELERRRIDTDWRAREARGEQAPTKEQMSGIVLDRETRERVARALPQWAQDIIAGLLQPQGLPIKRAERARIKKLPQWAQRTISNLEQSR